MVNGLEMEDDIGSHGTEGKILALISPVAEKSPANSIHSLAIRRGKLCLDIYPNNAPENTRTHPILPNPGISRFRKYNRLRKTFNQQHVSRDLAWTELSIPTFCNLPA